MNAASWKKAADFIAQQSADSEQFDTLPLSQLSIDTSGPPQVNYGTDTPLAASTPKASSISHSTTATTEHDRQIIPGILSQLYPSITTDNDTHMCTPGEHDSITDTITDGLNKYLEQAAQLLPERQQEK